MNYCLWREDIPSVELVKSLLRFGEGRFLNRDLYQPTRLCSYYFSDNSQWQIANPQSAIRNPQY